MFVRTLFAPNWLTERRNGLIRGRFLSFGLIRVPTKANSLQPVRKARGHRPRPQLCSQGSQPWPGGFRGRAPKFIFLPGGESRNKLGTILDLDENVAMKNRILTLSVLLCLVLAGVS